MADNISVTAGSGTTVATDDVAGVHYQKVKLAIGAADAANLLAVGAGVVDTGTPRITIASDDPVVSALSTLNTVAAAIQTATEGTEANTGTAITGLPRFDLEATSDLTRTFGSGSTAAEASLVAAVVGQTTRVHRLTATMAGAGYITLLNGSAGTELFRLTFPAAGAYVIDFDPRPYAVTSANTALYWARSAAVASTIQVWTVTSA